MWCALAHLQVHKINITALVYHIVGGLLELFGCGSMLLCYRVGLQRKESMVTNIKLSAHRALQQGKGSAENYRMVSNERAILRLNWVVRMTVKLTHRSEHPLLKWTYLSHAFL